MLHIHTGQIHHQSSQKRQRHHGDDELIEQRTPVCQIRRRVLSCQEQIDNLLRDDRNRQLHDIVHDCPENSEHIHCPVALHVLPEPA